MTRMASTPNPAGCECEATEGRALLFQAIAKYETLLHASSTKFWLYLLTKLLFPIWIARHLLALLHFFFPMRNTLEARASTCFKLREVCTTPPRPPPDDP